VPTDVLAQCGGHAQAGGFVVHDKGVHRFEEALLAAHAAHVAGTTVADPEPTWIDDEVAVGDVTERYVSDVSSLAPFGVGNPKPLVAVRRARVAAVDQFGSGKQHLDVSLEDPADGRRLSAFAFFASPDSFSRRLSVGDTVDVVGYADLSTFRGRTRVRLRIEDIL
jgi:single-stranded-DNA-specific exonuclease